MNLNIMMKIITLLGKIEALHTVYTLISKFFKFNKLFSLTRGIFITKVFAYFFSGSFISIISYYIISETTIILKNKLFLIPIGLIIILIIIFPRIIELIENLKVKLLLKVFFSIKALIIIK